MAVVFFLRVVFVLFCLPLRVEYSEKVQRTAEPSIASFDVWYSELVTVATIITCAIFILYQLRSIRNQSKELKSFSESIRSMQSKVDVVTRFYHETEAKFDELEAKSKAIKSRFSKLNEKEQKLTSHGSLKEEIAFYQRSWEYEFKAFSIFGIEDFKETTRKDLQAQLTMAKAYTERELRRVVGHTAEDKLSLEEVKCDVRRLQKYFGRR